ncbi:uncharacterized protein LOC135075125 isoform X1 [Ostrinia nubilalis]|uniref:uncharacterized protein LOC135075125 isoform X1 n=1 Tax=Ostrinia nubilalis TaxID=29057 RepID=UPI00308237A3
MTMDSDSAEKEVDKNARKGIIRKIAQCKASLTKAENFIRTLESPINKDVVSARLQQLQEVLPRHEQLLIELSTLDDTLDEDYFGNDAFEDRYLAIVASLRGLLAPQPPSPAPASGAQQSTDACATSVRLPEIDIPAFDGKDYTKYHSFIELFSAVIDNNSKLAAIQKLFYLRKYLKGEPLSLIEGLPVTGDSYGKALELLRNRYDNKFLIITNHVQELLDFNPLVKGAATNLRELVSHARQHLGALKTLGQPTDSWDMIVLPILLRKVDQFTCRAYHSERDTTKLPLLDDFFAFVERRASSFEESQRSEGKSNNNNNTYKTKVSNYASKTATQSWSCKYCSEQTHRLFKCDKFLAISPEERLNFISQNNLCKICFNSHTNKCKFHFKCEQCKDKSHNTLLHCNEKVSMHSNSNVSTILLPTIKAKVLCRDGKSHKVVRGLVDSGSQVSFMTADLAKALQLPLIDSNLNITALGKQNKTTSKAVNAEFVSLQNNYKCQVNCSIVDQITTKLPQQQVSWQNIQLPDSVVLADSDFDTPGDISFLLSADIFFQILLPRKIKLQNSNLYLIDTQFGSILSGEVNNNSHLWTQELKLPGHQMSPGVSRPVWEQYAACC